TCVCGRPRSFTQPRGEGRVRHFSRRRRVAGETLPRIKILVALPLMLGLVTLDRTAIAQSDDAGSPDAVPAAADGSSGGRAYSQSQIEQMVAPIALYPDSLVSQILIASTYPVQVVEAYQWQQKNKSVTGERAQEAAQSQGWDPSVQSLVAFPQIIDRMYQNMQW